MEPNPPQTREGRLAAVRLALAKRDEPYAGADLGNARRLFGILSLLSTSLALFYLPFDPPVEALGRAGWALAGLLIGFGFLIPRGLLRSSFEPSFDLLLVLSYLGLGGVALLEWLAGGGDNAYQNLFLFWALVGAGIHPPRRALPLLLSASLMAALPLVYEGWSADLAWRIAAPALMWSALGIVVMALMTYIRDQRVRFSTDQQTAETLARADELTGLCNRRALQEELATEIARTERAGSQLTFALIDIDRFKQVNDEHGHLEGDECLRQIAAALTRSMRSGDRAFRWGGDEFAVLLPDAGYEEARDALERIAESVESSCTRPDDRPLTISFGLAELDGESSPEELVGRADLALMSHKSASRA
jgi:diguanylate cyclase (GGDEF)-like protein